MKRICSSGSILLDGWRSTLNIRLHCFPKNAVEVHHQHRTAERLENCLSRVGPNRKMCYRTDIRGRSSIREAQMVDPQPKRRKAVSCATNFVAHKHATADFVRARSSAANPLFSGCSYPCKETTESATQFRSTRIRHHLPPVPQSHYSAHPTNSTLARSFPFAPSFHRFCPFVRRWARNVNHKWPGVRAFHALETSDSLVERLKVSAHGFGVLREQWRH